MKFKTSWRHMVGEGVSIKGPEGSFKYLRICLLEIVMFLPFPIEAEINEEPSNVGVIVQVYQNSIKAYGKV